jgi:O-antigen ligase
MAIIVLIGAVFTVVATLDQFNDTHGKPIVLGFDAAGLHFMGVLSILILGLVTVDRPSALRTAIVTVLIFPPVAIFAAAMVRYTFIALAGSLLLALILTEAGKRRHIVAVGLTIFFAVIFGLGARYDMAKVHAAYLLEETPETGAAQNSPENMPSCNLAVNMNNSIAIRKALALDAVQLIPNAGLVGTGLDSFMKFSCIRALEVHNSILQMAVEFGWLGGALFVALIVVVIYQLLPFARGSGAARFVLCSLVLTVLLCLAHGRVSRDSALFAFLGCAAGMRGCWQSRPA